MAQHIEYVPFGEVFVEERNNTWSTPYKFNAKELDEETGLYYYGARYYNPRSSVWLSVDPLAVSTPNVGSYVYCHGNPTNFIDVWGLYDKEADAKNDQKIASKIFGKERVGEVHNAGTNDSPDYRFPIFKDGQDNKTHPVEGGVGAYKPDNIINNRSQLNEYVDNNSNPNFHGVQFRFLDYRFIGGDSYFAGAINTDHNSYYNLMLGYKNTTNHFKHELGHWLQEKYYGRKVFKKIAFISMINYNGLTNTEYINSWTEVNANTLSYYYFNCPPDWDFKNYPIDIVQPIRTNNGVRFLFICDPVEKR